jgi:hypothetical protein
MLAYFECPKCEFDMVVEARAQRPHYCPLCSGDNGRDVAMRQRPVDEAPGKVEGRDARK